MTEEELKQFAKDIEEAKTAALCTVGSLNEGYGMFYAKYLAQKGYRLMATPEHEGTKANLFSADDNENLRVYVQYNSMLVDRLKREVEKLTAENILLKMTQEEKK